MSKLVLAIVGPTAIGKTTKAIALAQHFNTEILSADSRQFYRELSIGTAVPDKEELLAAKHHFIQHISITQNYSVGDFEREALARLNVLFKQKDILVLVGGSGLYVDAVCYGLDTFPEVDPRIRIELNKILEDDGIAVLQKELHRLDPAYHARVDLANPHRLIRALEISMGTGKPYSSFLKGKTQRDQFKSIIVGFTADRKVIYDRINQRVDQMMANGLLQEVHTLYPYKDLNALNTVGYKELFSFLEGKQSLEDAIEEIKKNTRRFAKRQLTWYRKNDAVMWFDHDVPLSLLIGKLIAQINDLRANPGGIIHN